ncbi:DUF3344 domain-containing protein [Streptomyces griseus]|uniref:DUF3344 domain-containing protein n=1 Tax=Streptomyces griseus TaxID=1911 RepID=UPI001F3A4F77|nr:DUF3344 domain-containing protein [Streptomyces griseus]
MRRSVLCALSCAVPSAAPPVASAAPPTPGEAARAPFAARHRAEPHGGIVRAADTSAKGTGTVDDKAAIGCADVDDDPNAYDSRRAERRVPAGSLIAWARLRRGGNPRVGGRGGRTLVAAYGKESEPLRRLRVRDGFETVGPRSGELRAALDGHRCPKGTRGRLGVIAHDGDRRTSGDYPEVRTGLRETTGTGDSANSANDVLNSGIIEFGRAGTTRSPAAGNTLGYDSDVFDLRGALRNGADRVHVRLGSREDTVRPGAPFPQADVRR